MITLRDVSKQFGDLSVLKHINLDVPAMRSWLSSDRQGQGKVHCSAVSIIWRSPPREKLFLTESAWMMKKASIQCVQR